MGGGTGPRDEKAVLPAVVFCACVHIYLIKLGKPEGSGRLLPGKALEDVLEPHCSSTCRPSAAAGLVPHTGWVCFQSLVIVWFLIPDSVFLVWHEESNMFTCLLNIHTG